MYSETRKMSDEEILRRLDLLRWELSINPGSKAIIEYEYLSHILAKRRERRRKEVLKQHLKRLLDSGYVCVKDGKCCVYLGIVPDEKQPRYYCADRGWRDFPTPQECRELWGGEPKYTEIFPRLP